MAKFCPGCGTPIIDVNSQFCSKCGAKLPISSPEVQPPALQSQGPTTKITKKKRSTLEWIAIFCGGAILFVIITSFIAGMLSGISGASSTSSPPTQSTTQYIPFNTPIPTLSIEQIKSTAQNVPYDDLFRYNEKYVGKTVYYRGEIIQIMSTYGDNYVIRLATKKSQYLGYIENIIYVHYQGSRYLEGDIIDLWSKVDGLETYSAVFGQSITIPKVTALHIELIEKASGSSSEVSVSTSQTPTIISYQNGAISITTSPTGAQIFINGQYIGMSPIIIEKPIGTYQLEIKKSGYLFETVTVQVKGGKTAFVDTSLIPVPIRKD